MWRTKEMEGIIFFFNQLTVSECDVIKKQKKKSSKDPTQDQRDSNGPSVDPF